MIRRYYIEHHTKKYTYLNSQIDSQDNLFKFLKSSPNAGRTKHPAVTMVRKKVWIRKKNESERDSFFQIVRSVRSVLEEILDLEGVICGSVFSISFEIVGHMGQRAVPRHMSRWYYYLHPNCCIIMVYQTTIIMAFKITVKIVLRM